jgi:hypothetical protein
MFPGMGGLDPSKLTPEVIAAITDAMKMLTPAQMMKMQTLMHNQMAGIDTTREMMELESSFPPGFREKMARVMYQAHGIPVPSMTPSGPSPSVSEIATAPKDESEARLVILRSVSQGMMSPEEAFRVLFP